MEADFAYKVILGVLTVGIAAILGLILKSHREYITGDQAKEIARSDPGMARELGEIQARLDRLDQEMKGVRDSAHRYRDTANTALGKLEGFNAFFPAIKEMIGEKFDDLKARVQGLEDRERAHNREHR